MVAAPAVAAAPKGAMAAVVAVARVLQVASVALPVCAPKAVSSWKWAAKSSHAAICQPLNKRLAAQASARRVATAAAMAAATAARHRHLRVVPVVSLTRCAPAST